MKKITTLLLSTAVSALVSSNANAFSLGVQDAWQMATDLGNTTNIGALSIGSQGATVWQEVNSSGAVFQGAKFWESAQEFTNQYIKENVAGANDFGSAKSFTGSPDLLLTIASASGVVTQLTASGFNYQYNTPQSAIFGYDGGATLANLTLIQPSFGASPNLTPTPGTYAGTGNTTATFQVVADLLAGGGFLHTSDGTNLDPYILNPAYHVLFSLNTNNTENGVGGYVTGANNGYNFKTNTACSTAGVGDCSYAIQLLATGTGHIDLLVERVIPEPESLVLMGIGFIGLGAFSKRKSRNFMA